ncbi:hypothetical protein LUZ60_014398 [Juncus effusus]|nr:hypothetical protein LUZ60_014398 [Juncus effusus]
MGKRHLIKILICTISPVVFISLLVLLFFLYSYLRRSRSKCTNTAIETAVYNTIYDSPEEAEDLITFTEEEQDLTVGDILEAPGEVIGRSSYGTVYRAGLRRTESTVLLRFIRPACVGRAQEVLPVVRMLGLITHGNLVPLRAVYVGPRGEKLFVHPFYAAGTLARFLRDGVVESQRWEITCKISIGIAKGLEHLHNGNTKPIIHGNLKTNNILLDKNLEPRLSDFGLHMILNLTAGQEMLEASALQGYKAPELIKMKDARKESDVYSLGVVLLEILTQKDPIKILSLLNSKDSGFEREISDVFREFFRLAMDCCALAPSSRPDAKSVLKTIEEIARRKL